MPPQAETMPKIRAAVRAVRVQYNTTMTDVRIGLSKVRNHYHSILIQIEPYWEKAAPYMAKLGSAVLYVASLFDMVHHISGGLVYRAFESLAFAWQNPPPSQPVRQGFLDVILDVDMNTKQMGNDLGEALAMIAGIFLGTFVFSLNITQALCRTGVTKLFGDKRTFGDVYKRYYWLNSRELKLAKEQIGVKTYQ